MIDFWAAAGRVPLWMAAGAAFVLSVIATALVRGVARHYGIVAQPKSDRWHKKPTAMLGGTAIFVALTCCVVLFQHRFNLAIAAGCTFIFLTGLVDDLIHLKPYQKLIGQVIASMIVVYSGLLLPWTESALVNMAVTFFWLIGITNAMNMLDNMDGLSAGVAAIAAVFMAINFFASGQVSEALVVSIFVASLLGFLVFNSNPASIFMGDCGSMFIGFFLASVALLTTTGTTGRTRSFLPVIAVPVLTLVIPIFDTTFVTLLRKLAGRRASQGGRDHTSHRLVALGLSERRAVWLLYSLAILSGVLALKVKQWPLHESVAAIAGFTTVLTMAGVYLAGVKVYDPDHAVTDNRVVAFLVDISYKRRIFETLLDICLISLAYYSAYLFRFGAVQARDANLTLLVRSLPIVVAVKIAVFLAMGVYRGIWRYTSLSDLITVAKAVFLGSVVSVLVIVYAFRFEGFSRGVFVLDGLLLLIFVAGSRVAFRIARRMLPKSQQREGRRVLVYGAGDAGELLIREFLNNEDLRYVPVGFLDDDARKTGKVIHGLRVYGGDTLASTCESVQAEEVVISSAKVTRERMNEIVRVCDSIGIPLRQMHIQLSPINAWQTDVLLAESDRPAAAAPMLHVREHGSTHVIDTPAFLRNDEHEA